MESEFEMTDLGLMKFFVGIEFQQYESGIFISQSNMQIQFKRIQYVQFQSNSNTGNNSFKIEQG